MPRGKSAREFAIDLTRFGEAARLQGNVILRKIAIDLDTRVVLDTPVDTGRARGNWYPSLNAPSSDRDDDIEDKSGSRALAEIVDNATRAVIGDVIWLTNNLPYILPLENGSSKQAPDGMVDVNLQAAATLYGGRAVT